MMRDAVGFSFSAPHHAFDRAGAVDACTAVVTSDTWCRPLRHLLLQVMPGKEYPHKRGVIPNKERVSVVRQMLVHPDVRELMLSTSGSHAANLEEFAELAIETRVPPWGPPCLTSIGRQSTDESTRDRDDTWVAAMLRFAESIDVRHGIITVMNRSGVHSEVALIGIKREGVDQHPHPDQFARMRAARTELGTRYVRFPRWGTIYSREHVNQLGGVDRIRDAVRPAVIRELGSEAIYVQLTDSVATATSAEASDKQRAFIELAAPLLPPIV